MRMFLYIFYLGFNTTSCFHILHLTFHKGCAQEIQYVADKLNVKLTTLFVPDCKPYTFDPLSYGNVLYNMGKERADRIWQHLSHYFNQFDAILISDTTPLSRIFLQNNWQKPLIIWICNRFDYSDRETLDCEFPHQAYYDLIKNACNLGNVRIFSYMDFEQIYMKEKGILIENFSIKPCAPIKQTSSFISFIPSNINKSEYFLIPPYHNDTTFIDLQKTCDELEISAYCGRYNGPQDLQSFKGIIHIPYSWSTLTFFESIQLGLAFFIPSYNFLKQLTSQTPDNFFHPEAQFFFDERYYHFSEFYNGQHPNVIYFDSWQDLQEKVRNTDFDVKKEETRRYAEIHRKKMLQKWQDIFTWTKNF